MKRREFLTAVGGKRSWSCHCQAGDRTVGSYGQMAIDRKLAQVSRYSVRRLHYFR